jgi:hypothetical protein
MKRSYFSDYTSNFLTADESSILGELVRSHTFNLNELQRNSWIKEISILKLSLEDHYNSYICLEYSIPRMGKRADAILLVNNVVVILEFKVGSNTYNGGDLDQVLDYALDLKNFHEQSHDKVILPVLVATNGPDENNYLKKYDDDIYLPIKLNQHNLSEVFHFVNRINSSNEIIDPIEWIKSIYKPTPTIIQAAQALYTGHNVSEISRSDSHAFNLDATAKEIFNVIEYSKMNKKKSICFITGVPGAGKTLAGLNIANYTQNTDTYEENAVFLSGNGPLVTVLQEALARDDVFSNLEQGNNIRKTEALNKSKAFIQNIHHFRDEYLRDENAPIERVVIFDEAQRAWTKEQTASFMKQRKGIDNFNMSEPEFLIGVMDRHDDWAVIICLIGGGQEINKGEAGLPEWFTALKENYQNWKIWVSAELNDFEYNMGEDLYADLNHGVLEEKEKLHLSVSVRSFRSEKVSDFVKTLLDCDANASSLIDQLNGKYPIAITRSFDLAKSWLKEKSRGTERIGILASSGGVRLKPHGINAKNDIDPRHWFLNGKNDVRSSFYLEDVATEFDIQGLELDWTCVCWDADLRFTNNGWDYKEFRGTSWNNINDKSRKLYLKNSYRVLLTRARQGMIIFVPYGDKKDFTRVPKYYDSIYNYLKNIGIKELN